jgi:ArsR family transcriptional regulator
MSKQRRRVQRAALAGCCDLREILPPRFFKALCDPNRIALLARLAACGRPCGVTELAACCPVDFSVTSRHLAALRDAGIVHAERRGKEVFYSVRFQEITTALRGMAAAIGACCPPRSSPKKGKHK